MRDRTKEMRTQSGEGTLSPADPGCVSLPINDMAMDLVARLAEIENALIMSGAQSALDMARPLQVEIVEAIEAHRANWRGSVLDNELDVGALVCEMLRAYTARDFVTAIIDDLEKCKRGE